MLHPHSRFSVRERGAVVFLSTLLATLLFVGGVPQGVQAQGGPSLRSVQRPVRIAIDPTYQRYESVGGEELTQLSTYLTAQVPITSRLTVEGRAGVARMGGGRLPNVQGLTDATGRVMYAQPIGEGSLVLSTRINAPVGKQNLDTAAVRTTQRISQNYYDFRVSSFSRGLSVSPRVTWAYPVSDRLAIGIGVGYQHYRGFRPQARLESDYVPGDGIGVNSGADYKLTETSALGVDLAVKRYGADQLGGSRQFDAGTRVAGTLRYLQRSGFTTIRGVLRYTNWEESKYLYQIDDGPQRGQVIPSHAMALASYQTRILEGIRLSVRASGHRYTATIQEGGRGDAKTVGRVHISPSVEVGEIFTLAPHGQVTYGSYLGLGGGLRIEAAF